MYYPVSACKKFTVNIICPLNVAVLTSKMGSMYGSSVVCFYGKELRINTYTYLMLISRSINFQSELSGGGISWPHMQSSNTAEEVTQKIADCATNQLDWSKFQAKNLIHSLSSPKGTVSRYCACFKLWFLDRMSRNQKMRGEYEKKKKSVCIALGRVQYDTKTSQDYRSMIYCSC